MLARLSPALWSVTQFTIAPELFANTFGTNFLAQRYPSRQHPKSTYFFIYQFSELVIMNRATLASQTIITMLPSSPEVQNVYGEGVLPTLRRLTENQARSTLCIDSTTLDIIVAKNVAADVVSTGAQMVDATVSGGIFFEDAFYAFTDIDGQV